jgi:transcriptional regulator with XRE-family HTH domain
MRAAAFRKTFSLMRGYPFDPVARKAEIATFARMTIRPASRHPHGQPSIASVAARAGVSIATVSRVVNGVANKASAETTARVRQAILELGYRPISASAAAASSPCSRRTSPTPRWRPSPPRPRRRYVPMAS